MQKVAFLMNRAPDQSKMQFCKYWANDGYQLLCAIPGVDRVVMNFVYDNTQRNPLPRSHEDFDLMAEAWFTEWTPETVAASVGDMISHGQVGHIGTIVVEERLFRETSDPYLFSGVPGQCKRIALLQKKNGISEAEWSHEWGVVHPTLVDTIPEVVRYAQNWVSDESCAGTCAGSPHNVGGIVEMRYDSLDTMENRTGKGGKGHLNNFLEGSSISLVQEWEPSVS